MSLSNLEFIYALPPLQGGGLSQLERMLGQAKKEQRPYRLVVVDCLLAASAEQKRMDLILGDYKPMSALRNLARKYEVAIIVVHHLRKLPAADIQDAFLNTTGLTAAVDAFWVMRAHADDDQLIRLDIHGNDIQHRTMAISFRKTKTKRGWAVAEEGIEVGAGPTEAAILRLLRKQGKPMAAGEIATVLGMDRNTIYQKLKNLRDKRKVGKVDGKYCYPGDGI